MTINFISKYRLKLKIKLKKKIRLRQLKRLNVQYKLNYYRYGNDDLKLKQNLYTSFNHISKHLRFTHSIDRSISIYHTKPIDKVLGYLIKKGQKSVAEKIFYNVLYTLRKKTNSYPLKVLYRVLKNVRPVVDVKTIKKSGRKLEVPKILGVSRRFFLATNWLIKSSESHKEYNRFNDKFLSEILNSIKFKSASNTLKKSLMLRVIKSRINQRYRYFNEKKKLMLFNSVKSSTSKTTSKATIKSPKVTTIKSPKAKFPKYFQSSLTKSKLSKNVKSPKNSKSPIRVRYIVDMKKSLSAVRGAIRKNFI
jgi:small subunit ribosomal protein S7